MTVARVVPSSGAVAVALIRAEALALALAAAIGFERAAPGLAERTGQHVGIEALREENWAEAHWHAQRLRSAAEKAVTGRPRNPLTGLRKD